MKPQGIQMVYRTILVPLDGSSLSERGLPMAATVAQATGAQLVLAQVVRTSAVDPGEAQGEAEEEVKRYLAGIASQLGEQGLRVEITMPTGTPVEGILSELELRQADLVVMCTHGRSGLRRWFYGSVAEGVLARSPVPVLLARPADLVVMSPPELGWPRLLVPLDGSAFAEAVLPHAKALAQALDGTIVLLQAVVLRIPRTPELFLVSTWQRIVEEETVRAENYLAKVAEHLKQDGLRVQTVVRCVQTVVESGAAAEVILQEKGRPAGTGLVVMATHGRTGLKRLLFGSVAMAVLQRGLRPLLLLRPVGLPQLSPEGNDGVVMSEGLRRT
ncbi:MAG: universal stress protein UspA [Chloroflexota bacterium]|nr:MAG: universal stress protein UspA [Chloroflexota bacterium]